MSRSSSARRLLVAVVASMLAVGALALRPAEAAVDRAAVSGQATRLYQAYFLRAPDPAGHAYWVGRLATGMRLQDVSQFFAESPEFRGRYGSRSNAANW